MSVAARVHRMNAGTLLKHAIVSAWGIRVRLFAMGAIAAFGVSIFIGAFSAIESIFASRDHWYDAGRLADLELRVVPDDVENFPSFSGIRGVAAFKERMVYPGSATITSRNVSVLLIADAQVDAPAIDTYRVIAGKSLDSSDESGVLIDRSLANYHGVGVGDDVRIKLGKDRFTVHVRGIVEAPEFLLAPANPSLFVPSKGSLGVVYANEGLLQDRFGFTPANSVLFRFAQGADRDRVRNDVISTAEQRLNVDWTMTRKEQFSYLFLNKDLGVFRIVVPLIVAVSCLSTLFVAGFLFVQWILRERQSIGIFMALGHSAAAIARSFAVAIACISAGAVAGGLAWAGVVMQAFARNFSSSVGLPMPQLAFSSGYTLAGIGGAILVFVIAGSIALANVLFLTPLDAMRASVSRLTKPGALSSLLGKVCGGTWLRLPLRNVLRTPGVSVMTIVSVALGFGITAAFFISFSSFVGTSIASVQDNRWTLITDFVAPVWNEDIPKIMRGVPGVRDYSPYVKGVAQGVGADHRINLYIGGFDPKKPWTALTVLRGSGLAPTDPNGILLEESAARELDMKVGDALTIEAQGVRHSAVVRGIISGALPGETIVPVQFVRQIEDLSGRSTGVFILTDGDPAATARALERKADVEQVLSKDQVAQQILAASGQITDIIRLGALLSVLIAALFVFACVSYTVSRRSAEYQTLRVLGYREGFITKIVVAEVCILGAVSLLVALPIGTIVARIINGDLSAAWFHVDTILSTADYLKAFVPGMILLPLVALPIARALLAEPLDAFLRTREVA